MRRREPHTTLEHVARQAGVHPSTVSRYFSHPDLLADRTAAKIRSAADMLGYVPDMLAGSLASNRRRLAALLVPSLTYSNFNLAIERIASGLSDAGTNVMLGVIGNAPERTDDLVKAALRWRCDAVIAWTPLSGASARLLRSSGSSVIEICDASVTPIDIGVGISEARAGSAIAEYLSARGFRRPAFIGTRGPFSILRAEAFGKRWEELRGARPAQLLLDPPVNFEQGALVFAATCGGPVRPDVIVCASDYLAQGVIIEAQSAGLRVPDDLAVIGYGNTPMSAAMRPAITTVDLNTARVPEEILAVLDARAEGRSVPGGHIDVGFSLIPRASG